MRPCHLVGKTYVLIYVLNGIKVLNTFIYITKIISSNTPSNYNDPLLWYANNLQCYIIIRYFDISYNKNLQRSLRSFPFSQPKLMWGQRILIFFNDFLL